jgi:hypothetical protein
MNLGVIHASKLQLGIIPHRKVVPLIFRFLQESSLPSLRHLTITMDQLWPGGMILFDRTFDPMHHLDDNGPGFAQAWKLDRSLTDRLESVLVELHGMDVLQHASEFFDLFGTANRSGVLRVLPERVQLKN